MTVTVLPYLAGLGACLLLLTVQPPDLAQGGALYAGVGVVALITVRQFVTLSDHVQLTSELQEYAEALHRSREEMAFQARHDPVTGLCNRAGFYEALGQQLQQAYVARTRLAVLFVDLDHFKPVNDTYGHAAGDELLLALGERVTALLGPGETMARLGGDEFGLILAHLGAEDGSGETVAARAEEILRQIREPFAIGGNWVRVGASIGFSLFPDHAADPDQLVALADEAMYLAKTAGKGQVRGIFPARG
ncbi:diguanylate cyclase domain-containing protein [Deinococcus lacus]|uniref:Diguanylate cyclase domain-containing protein n=1 Tax=Deinococcus lacus TaxID=392561 RepID=A0ABW1YE65_9DEIO